MPAPNKAKKPQATKSAVNELEPEKLRLLTAALLSGMSPIDASMQFGCTLRYAKRIHKEIVPELEAKYLAPDAKKSEIPDLIDRYVQGTLEALIAQTKLFADPVYLRQQPAESLAVLHSVMADRAIYLLGAAERAKALGPPRD